MAVQIVQIHIVDSECHLVTKAVERFNDDRCRWDDAVVSDKPSVLRLASADVGRFFDLFTDELSELSRRRMLTEAVGQIDRLVDRIETSVRPSHEAICNLGLV